MNEELEPIKPLKAYASTATEFKEKLTEGEAQYLAGLIDGEGSITAWVRHRKLSKLRRVHTSKSGSEFVFEVKIGVCHPIILQLCNLYGGFWYYQRRQKPRKPIYYWVWNHRLIRHYLSQLIPFLRIKKKQAVIMLKIMKLCHGTDRTEEEKKLLRKYAKQIKRLNHKAYPCNTSKYEHLRVKK